MDEIHEIEPPDVITSDTPNATKIDPHEAPQHRRRRFEHFRAYNRGLWNGPRRENKELMHKQDDLHLYDAVSSQACLTNHQQQRGRHLFEQLEINELTNQTANVAQVIFALCVLVANDDGNSTRYYPKQIADDCLESLAADLDLSETRQLKLIERVRSRVNL